MMKRILLTLGLVCGGLVCCWFLPVSTGKFQTHESAPIHFSHLYITSENPQSLAHFYEQVFGVQKIENQDFSLPGFSQHFAVRTPGYENRGPVLVFLPSQNGMTQGPLQPFDLGYAHICFESDNVNAVMDRVRAHGGRILSRFDDLESAPGIYATDPDGNVIEIHIPFPTPLTPNSLHRSLKALGRSHLKLEPAEQDGLRFLHVNINSSNWHETVAFYQQALSAEPTGFERNYEGGFISRITGVENAVVRGLHVALPGYSAGGPTFEIFTYNKQPSQGPLTLKDNGPIVTGFVVDHLDRVLEQVSAAGGKMIDDHRPMAALISDRDGNLIYLVSAPSLHDS